MELPELPPKYYLSHFFEFLDFLEKHYSEVLKPQDKKFISDFKNLSEDAQCTYVRMVNLKGHVFDKSYFKKYAEITDYPSALKELETHNFIGPLSENEKPGLLAHLTKPKLLKWL